jgi:putative heme-binding domain-containing protein
LALAQVPPAQDAETGKGMFRIYCSACHGIRAQGGRGPDLTQTKLDNAALAAIIKRGSPSTEMPGYADSLGDDNILRVVAYIRSAAQPPSAPIAGDAAAGEKTFWGKGGCGGCHRVGTRGGRLGPDLSLVGRTRSVQHLREAMTDPSRDIAAGYAKIVVVTSDGKTVEGVERGFGNFSAQLVDSSGAYHSFVREEVRSMERTKQSLMPRSQLSDKEMNDVIVYLQTTGRKQ